MKVALLAVLASLVAAGTMLVLTGTGVGVAMLGVGTLGAMFAGISQAPAPRDGESPVPGSAPVRPIV